LTDTGEKEYTESAMKTARSLWGAEADEMRQHIEATAGAVWRISEAELSPMTEPVTKLRHGGKP
jgi:hypothetical protein